MFKSKRKMMFFAAGFILAVLAGGGLGFFLWIPPSPIAAPGLPGNTRSEKEASEKDKGWEAITVFDDELVRQVLDVLKTRYVDPVDESGILAGCIQGMVASLGDRHSVYFPPEEVEEFKERIEGNFEGVGIELSLAEGKVFVAKVFSGAPAASAGVKSGDVILKVDGKDVLNMPVPEVADLLRGKSGTKVNLTVQREGAAKPIEFSILRAEVVQKSVEWKPINYKGQDDPKGKLAYLKISFFAKKTVEQFEKAVDEIQKFRKEGLILDLRDNPGGHVDVTLEIAGYWIGKETVMYTEERDGGIEEASATHGMEFKNMRMIVLVDKMSASASEILASALQDYNKAILVGEKTYGKFSVQLVYDKLKGGGILKVTIARWLTSRKRSIDGIGVVPDVAVPMTEEDRKEGRDPQLDAAIRIMRFSKWY